VTQAGLVWASCRPTPVSAAQTGSSIRLRAPVTTKKPRIKEFVNFSEVGEVFSGKKNRAKGVQ